MTDKLNPKKEPKNSHVIEFSNDGGDHVVVDVPTAKDAKAIAKIAEEAGMEEDRDEGMPQRIGANRTERLLNNRDPNQVRYRVGKVVNPDEDLEPEVDSDYSDYEHVATGQWKQRHATNVDDTDLGPNEVVPDGPWDGSDLPKRKP